MAYRHRPEYGESVTDRLVQARAEYDQHMADHEARISATRQAWSAEIAQAIESGMSYEEIVHLVNVSHSSVARAMREFKNIASKGS